MKNRLVALLPRFVAIFLGFPLLLYSALSCGGSSGITDTLDPVVNNPQATSITVSPASTTLTTLGATVQLSASVLDQNGQVLSGASVSWTSSASGVASVGSGGLVTALSSGSATITATSGSASGSAEVSVSVSASPLSITTGSLESGTVGVVYSQTLAATGGSGTYSWSVIGGSLPAGLSLSSSGTISGTPTTAGTSTFTVQVASGGATASKQMSITNTMGGASYVSVLSWGGNGTMDGKFGEAGGVAIDAGGNIWVADRFNETIQQFDASGNYLKKFATTIETAATYDGPSHIGFTQGGDLYAFSTSGGWVAKYDESGTEELLGFPQYGYASKLDFAVDPRNGDFLVVFVGAVGKFGDGAVLWQKTLNDLRTVTVDSQGNVYLAAFPGVQKYDADGNLVAEVDLGTTRGSLAVDSSDRLYFLSTEVSDRYLKVFDGSLNLLTDFEIDANCWSYTCNFAVAGDGEYLYLSLSSPVARELTNMVFKYERR